MKWKLKIKNFGKIKEAEIHDSSLRFIVGNNNSGKSYLMTLLWGMEKIKKYDSGEYLSNIESNIDMSSWINEEQYRQICSGIKCEIFLLEYMDIINCFVNLFLQNVKDSLVSNLFNFKKIYIDELSMHFDFDKSEKFIVSKINDTNIFELQINSKKQQMIINMENTSIESQRLFFLKTVTITLLKSIFIEHDLRDGEAVYLPAARTGFILTKDIINKTSRRIAFANEENLYEPFTMPILKFLDILETVCSDIKLNNKYEKICSLIEDKMLQGKLLIKETQNKALSFTPDNSKDNLPLRATSAVVTEISPLYLLLKNETKFYKLKSIYYEEPEMCLHPQLQQIVARILIQLANTGVNLTVTTHSDIIIQHVNNMIRLGHISQYAELMQKYGYEIDDLLKPQNVSMYQFKENADGTTTLEELTCGDYGFEVPTFNIALDNMLEEVYAIQEE